MKNLCLFFALAISFSCLAQNPSSIESVEYDPGQDRWFVSNGKNTMLYTYDAGESWGYFGNASANYGMEVVGNYLYAISDGDIVCYDLFSGGEVDTESIIGTNFLNGMGSRGILLAPTLSYWLYDYIYKGIQIPQEVDIKRFKKNKVFIV